jgi:uncharacterized protein
MIPFSLTIIAVAIVGLIAGAIASVAGFGVGSLLTPLLAIHVDLKTAVAVVSIPHFFGTALRFMMLRRHVDRAVLLTFGLTSAAGGLVGAFLGTFLRSPILSAVLGVLLLFAGITGLTNITERLHFKGWTAWVAGALSGIFGGLVGNQGGIRSAALLGFDLSKQAFVATATAVALMVDGARLPVYVLTHAGDIARAWPFVAAGTAGVIAGTLVGERVLRRVPENTFRTIVSAVILLLGFALLVSSARQFF